MLIGYANRLFRQMFLLILIVVSLGHMGGFTLHAQTADRKVVVDGYVLTRDRKPIELATVKVLGSALVGTNANLKGYYRLELTPTTDTVRIEYSSIGYRTEVKLFAKGIVSNQRVNPEMAESATTLDGVTVVGSATKANRMETVKADHVLVGAAPNKSVEALVGTYAGVSQTNELSSQYTVRGGNFDENLIYVNGIEVYRPLLIRSAQQEGISFVNPYMTQSIGFSAGAFNSEYGDRSSSVLDIRYKTPQAFEANLSAGLLNNSLYIGSRHGRLSQVSSVRYKSGKLLLKGMDTKGVYDPTYVDAQSYLRWQFNDQWSVGLLGNLSLTRYHFMPKKRETVFGTLNNMKKFNVYFDGQELDRFLTYFGALQLTYRPTDDREHRWHVAAFNSLEDESYDIIGAYYLNSSDQERGNKALATGVNFDHARNRLNYSVLSLNYQGRSALPYGQQLKWGAEVKLEQVNDHIAEWSMLDSAGYNLPRRPDAIQMKRNLYSDESMKSMRAALFVQDRLTIDTHAGRFGITAGVRTSWWSFNKEWLVSPRLTATFRPHEADRWLFHFGGGLYSQAPFYKELQQLTQDANGNQYLSLSPSVRAQGSAQVLAGATYTFPVGGRPFRLTVEGFYKHLYRINPYYVNNVKIRYLGANVGRGYLAGVDFKLFGEFVPDVDSWLTVSLLHSRQTIPGVGAMRMPNAPFYNCSLFFQDYFPGFKRIRLSLRGVLSGGLPQINPEKGFSQPLFTGTPYRRLDIGLTYRLFDRELQQHARKRLARWIKHVDLGVSIFNLFDIYNVDSYYWVADAYRNQYAVPNFLTGRQVDFQLSIDF